MPPLVQSKVCAVVGGCGFLGRHMVEQLLERGYQVHVFDIRVSFEDDRVMFFTGCLTKKEARELAKLVAYNYGYRVGVVI